MIKKYRLKEDTNLLDFIKNQWIGNKSIQTPQYRTFSKGFEVRQNSEYSLNYYGEDISFKPEEIENNNNWELINDIQYYKCISNTLPSGGHAWTKLVINKIYKLDTIQSNPDTDYSLIGVRGSCDKTRFIPSTEEEYNIQEGINQPTECEVDKWLRETKALNLSINDIKIRQSEFARRDSTFITKMRVKLGLSVGEGSAEFLHNLWNPIKEMKEEFVLPEKWCVKSDSTKIDIISKFYDKCCKTTCYTNTKHYYINSYWHSHNLSSNNSMFSASPGSNYTSNVIKNTYTEISYEQFLKHVIKEDIKEPQFSNTMSIERKFSIQNIEDKLSKHYDKDDVKEILEIINK